MQARVDDRSGFAPRVGVTWSPVANGATTLRASAGVFHGFLPLVMIEQTLRLDGTRQREIYLTNPAYPDAGPVEELAIPTNKYLIGDFNLQRNLRYSAGLDQVLSRRVRVNLLYNYIHLQQQPRGRNVNPLIGGVRADPEFANIIDAVTDAETRRHEFSINAVIALAPAGPSAQNAPLFDWRRLNMNVTYALIRLRSNSDGSWVVPPTGDPEDDWGPGNGDQPYRVQVLLTSTQIRNVTANVTFSTNAGNVYTQTTGRDDNRDGFVNDRPAGVGLRSLRGAGQVTLNARVQYAFQLSPPVVGTQPRYRASVFANIQNVTNHQNLGGYSGVMTSRFFRKPTLAANPRRVDVGMNVTF
jgi:hypothetical protein